MGDSETEEVRQLVCTRIGEVEHQMKSLEALRKSLVQKAYQAKCDILHKFVSERESMYSKEVSLLSQVDQLLHSKDDALVTQLNKLNQVLGCLRNCLESPHPCGDCLEKYEDIDMLSAEEVDMEFTSANDLLRNSCTNGKPAVSYNTEPAHLAWSHDDYMTKWLLTPTNNHVASAVEVRRSGERDFTSTEWLIQHHTTKPAVQPERHFENVKSDRRDDWLNGVVTSRNSLYMYALANFESIVTQDTKAWLHQAELSAHRERSMSDTVSESSVGTSSLSSSCVIIPSTTSSEASDLPPTLESEGRCSTSPEQVGQWLASCESASTVISEEWLRRPSRPIQSGVASVTQSVGSDWLAGTGEVKNADEWLVTPHHHHHIVADDNVSGEFEEEEAPLAADLEAWLPVIRGKLEELSVDYPSSQEKLDTSCEKMMGEEWVVRGDAPLNVSEWKQGYPTSDWLSVLKPATQVNTDFSKSDWLSGEEKGDESCKHGGTTLHKSADREWLLIINRMNQISSSSLSDWLSTNKDQTVSLKKAPVELHYSGGVDMAHWLR